MHEKPQLASKYLTRFSRLMRTILNNSKSKFVSLSYELEAVKLYMEMEQLRFAGKFEFEMKIEEKTNQEEIYLPTMLIQPYLENAVKHGMINLERKGKICLEIHLSSNNRLTIKVMDNGIGRAKSKDIMSQRLGQRKSYGMDITSNRIELLNEIYNVNANIEYIDHINPTGTDVIITLNAIYKEQLPWKKSEQSL
jgi:LytS/YehU family sensor histidine kinase